MHMCFFRCRFIFRYRQKGGRVCLSRTIDVAYHASAQSTSLHWPLNWPRGDHRLLQCMVYSGSDGSTVVHGDRTQRATVSVSVSMTTNRRRCHYTNWIIDKLEVRPNTSAQSTTPVKPCLRRICSKPAATGLSAVDLGLSILRLSVVERPVGMLDDWYMIWD